MLLCSAGGLGSLVYDTHVFYFFGMHRHLWKQSFEIRARNWEM